MITCTINPDSVDIDAIESRHFETKAGTANPLHDMLDLIGAARGYKDRIAHARECLDDYLSNDPDPAEAYEKLLYIERVLKGRVR